MTEIPKWIEDTFEWGCFTCASTDDKKHFRIDCPGDWGLLYAPPHLVMYVTLLALVEDDEHNRLEKLMRDLNDEANRSVGVTP